MCGIYVCVVCVYMICVCIVYVVCGVYMYVWCGVVRCVCVLCMCCMCVVLWMYVYVCVQTDVFPCQSLLFFFIYGFPCVKFQLKWLVAFLGLSILSSLCQWCAKQRPATHLTKCSLVKMIRGAGEMAQALIALAALPEDGVQFSPPIRDSS